MRGHYPPRCYQTSRAKKIDYICLSKLSASFLNCDNVVSDLETPRRQKLDILKQSIQHDENRKAEQNKHFKNIEKYPQIIGTR